MVIIVCYGHRTNITSWLQTDEPKPKYEYGVGIVINLKNDLYVLTCAHTVLKSTYKSVMYRYTSNKFEKIYLDLVCIADELDLALFKLKTKSDVKGVKLCDFNKSISFSNDNIASLNALFYKNNKTHIEINKHKYECKVTNVKIHNIEHPTMPPLPWIEIIVKDNSIYNDKKLSGLSGSSIFSNNKIIGILSSSKINSKQITLIPGIIVYRFISEFIKTNKYSGLCNIIAKVANCEIETEGKKYNGISIDDDYNINYNKGINVKNRRNLQKNDIIYKINNKQFKKSKGKILLYDDNLSTNIPISTYIALNYMAGDKLDLKIYRPNGATENLKINARSVKTATYLQIVHNYSYYNCNGMIFVELSQYMIDCYICSDIKLCNLLYKYILETPYRDNNDKIIVLIDIIENEIPEKRLAEMKKINLPLIQIFKKDYDLMILQKINNNKINDLSDIKKALKKSKNILCMESTNKNIKIRIEENKIKQIEIIK